MHRQCCTKKEEKQMVYTIEDPTKHLVTKSGNRAVITHKTRGKAMSFEKEQDVYFGYVYVSKEVYLKSDKKLLGIFPRYQKKTLEVAEPCHWFSSSGYTDHVSLDHNPNDIAGEWQIKEKDLEL